MNTTSRQKARQRLQHIGFYLQSPRELLLKLRTKSTWERYQLHGLVQSAFRVTQTAPDACDSKYTDLKRYLRINLRRIYPLALIRRRHCAFSTSAPARASSPFSPKSTGTARTG